MSLAEDLAQLARMRNAGELTDDEFSQAKTYLLEEYEMDAAEGLAETSFITQSPQKKPWTLRLGWRGWLVVVVGILFAYNAAIYRSPEQRREALRLENPVAYAAMIKQEEDDAIARAAAEQAKAEQDRLAAVERAERDRIRAEEQKQLQQDAERREQLRQDERGQEEARKREAGFHCLSGWDGSHRAVVTWTKSRLNDPESFQHDTTRITPVSHDGSHSLLMQYRAKNGFGGVVRGSVIATIRNSDCAVTEAVAAN